MIRILILLCCCSCMILAQEAQPRTKSDVYIFRDGSDSLLYIKCIIPQKEQKHRNNYYRQGAAHPRPYIKLGKQNINCLYRTAINDFKNNAQPVVFLFRAQFDEHSEEALSVQFDQDQWSRIKFQLARKHIVNGDDGLAIKQMWHDNFKYTLMQSIQNHEDHELEILLYWRFFGSLPKQRFATWKRDHVMQFLYTFSGLNDIEDAVPLEKTARLQHAALTEDPPDPILLPQVPVAKSVDALTTSLANYVPRSCYYIEWPNVDRMWKSINFTVSNFDQWSQGTYPQTADKAIEAQIKRLGLSEEWMHSYKGINSIAVAGWDGSIQSGTNFMMLINSDQPIEVEKKFTHSLRLQEEGKHILIVSTCARLIKMSQRQEQSLAAVDQFRASRKRLSQQVNEEEFAFAYLSDYWLTNFVSPRWYILSARRRQVDARIRLAYLFKEIYRAETGQEVSLTEIAQQERMDKDDLEWILSDLIEQDGTIVHKTLGGIGAHTPIDEMPFDKVSAVEKKDYETFRNMYMRRWRQMDPIAFQVVQSPNALWKTRLYVSPISNRSDFRWTRDLFLPQKQTHHITEVDRVAFGVSIKVATKMAMGMGMPMKLPAVIGAQVVAYDAAPSSYTPSSWLEELPKHDWMSYMRIPAAALVPPLVFQQLGLLGGGLRNMESEYEDLQIVDGIMDDVYSLYSWTPEDQSYIAVSQNPMTLLQIKNAQKKQVETAAPADVHLWYDCDKAYHMTHKLWQLAVKNRTLASWRRQNRLFRMRTQLGIQRDQYNQLKQRVNNGHYFPTQILAASQERYLPKEKGLGQTQRYGSGSATRKFDELPMLFFLIKKINTFISIENNALYFENHIQCYPESDQEGEGAADPQTTGETGLDFDD